MAGSTVRVQLNRIGEREQADRCLDAMEQGRLYVVEGEDVGRAADRIAARLPEGWQHYLGFEL